MFFFISGAKRKSLQGHAFKNDRKALKAYSDLYKNGGLFYWQLHVKIGCQGHLLGVDL